MPLHPVTPRLSGGGEPFPTYSAVPWSRPSASRTALQPLPSVWWLMMWRGTLVGLVVGGTVGIIGGFLIALAGHPELGGIGGSIAGLIVGPFWWMLVVHMALKKKYKEFRIALVPPLSRPAAAAA